MNTHQIAVIVGSLRRDSLNQQLAHAVVKLLPASHAAKLLPLDELPMYNQDDDTHQADAVKRFKADVADSQGLLFVTPEYNRSIPGVLKNALDHASRPFGQSAWTGKPAGIIGVSPGAAGTAMAQQHLRNVLACLDVPTMGQPEAFVQAKEGLFDAEGNFGADIKDLMQGWVAHYLAWVAKQSDQTPRSFNQSRVNFQA